MNKIIFSITHLSGGGAERVVCVWANELANKGYDVGILISGHYGKEYPISKEVKIYSVCNKYEEYEKLSLFAKLHRKRRLLKEINPTYVISFLEQNQVWTMISSYGLGIKRIETVRNNPWKVAPQNIIYRWLWLRTFSKAYRVIFQSKDQMGYFEKRIQNKGIVIPNPISDIYNNFYKTDFSIKPEHFIAVGRLTEQKNYQMMIEAFGIACKKNPNLQLSIYGEGEQKEYIEHMIHEKKLDQNISLKGRSNNIEIELSKNDIFLMSSDYEGMPNSLMEAMASKLICISTSCKTGPSNLIDDGINGFLVPVGDPIEMAACIERVMNMSLEDVKNIGECAHKKIIAYCSVENSVDRLANILK